MILLTIQQVGNEILTNQPRRFYIFCGAESGIKDKYIEHLQSYYNNNKVELDSFETLVSQLQYEPLISIPTLYIIRYDKEFWSKVSESTANLISDIYIDGTVVMIFSENASAKISKNLGDYAIDIAPLSEQLKMKYLVNEFPQISEVIIQAVINLSENYLMARNVCQSISKLPATKVNDITAEDIDNLFVIRGGVDEKAIQGDIYCRDVAKALVDFDNFSGDRNFLFYNIMNTMTTLEKQNNRAWNKSDVVMLNDLAYQFLLQSRTIYVDLYNVLVMLFCSMGISPVPMLRCEL